MTVQKVGSEPLPDVRTGWRAGSRGGGPKFKGIPDRVEPLASYKQSGLGNLRWGRHGLEDFTEIKNLAWS